MVNHPLHHSTFAEPPPPPPLPVQQHRERPSSPLSQVVSAMVRRKAALQIGAAALIVLNVLHADEWRIFRPQSFASSIDRHGRLLTEDERRFVRVLVSKGSGAISGRGGGGGRGRSQSAKDVSRKTSLLHEAAPFQGTASIVNDDVDEDDNERPTMHTFFDHIDASTKNTGMSDEGDVQMLEAWTTAWRSRGWNTRILTLDDAKAHPDYESYNRALDDVPLAGMSGKNAYYNKLCYVRWLAMATVGGGWMSDYDTVPLVGPPSDPSEYRPDVFTAYEWAVPSLMAGSSKEWTRMAHELLKSGIDHKDSGEPLFSDMMALEDLIRGKRATFRWTSTVVEGRYVLTGKHFTEEDCRGTANMKAVHFSHNALREGQLRPGETMNDRPRIMLDWLDMWKSRCEAIAKQEEVDRREGKSDMKRPEMRQIDGDTKTVRTVHVEYDDRATLPSSVQEGSNVSFIGRHALEEGAAAAAVAAKHAANDKKASSGKKN